MTELGGGASQTGKDSLASDYSMFSLPSAPPLVTGRSSLYPQTSREHAAALHDLAASLSNAVSREDVATAVVSSTMTVFQAVGAVVAIVAEDGNYVELVRTASMPAEIQREWIRFPISEPVPLADVARTGEPVFIDCRDTWCERYPKIGPLLEATGHHAVVTLPLIVAGASIGSLGLSFDAPRVLSDDERNLALSAAFLCAQALERARLFDEEREARAAAEAANRSKTDFLAVMSHELRTPLNAIGGYAELLEMGVYGEVNDVQRDAIHRLQKSQRHLLSLITEVLSYARIESGTTRFDLKDIGVGQAMAMAEALVVPQARSKGLALVVKYADAEVTVRADGEKLQQILLNLLSNAVKFTDRGEITLSVEPAPRSVSFTVADTGIGIPPEKLESVFEPFVQIDPMLTRTSQGVGLGLAISRDLARGMGGDLRVESRLGVGSSFVLTLPR